MPQKIMKFYRDKIDMISNNFAEDNFLKSEFIMSQKFVKSSDMRKFQVQINLPKFILDSKITEKEFLKEVQLFLQNRAETAPSAEYK